MDLDTSVCADNLFIETLLTLNNAELLSCEFALRVQLSLITSDFVSSFFYYWLVIWPLYCSLQYDIQIHHCNLSIHYSVCCIISVIISRILLLWWLLQIPSTASFKNNPVYLHVSGCLLGFEHSQSWHDSISCCTLWRLQLKILLKPSSVYLTKNEHHVQKYLNNIKNTFQFIWNTVKSIILSERHPITFQSSTGWAPHLQPGGSELQSLKQTIDYWCSRFQG